MRIDHYDDIIDRIKPSDRAGFIGPTESGKTTALTATIKHFDNAVIVSPKRQWDWDLEPIADPELAKLQLARYSRRAYDLKELAHEMAAVTNDESGDPIVFLPQRLRDRRAHMRVLDEPFWWSLERGNTLMATDELYYHGHGANFESVAPGLYFHITGGRSEGCGTMYGFQRPVWVPRVALSETEHFILFYLQEADDRDAMDWRAGKERGGVSPIDWQTLKNEDHTFVYITRRFVSEPLVLNLEKEAA